MSQEERLLLVAWKTELANEIVLTAHSLMVDELYTKEHAIEQLIKIINGIVSETPKIY